MAAPNPLPVGGFETTAPRSTAPVVAAEPDTALKYAGPAAAQGILEQARKGVPSQRVVRYGQNGKPIGTRAEKVSGSRTSPADYYRTGAPGSQIKADMEGKAPKEQAAIASAHEVTENNRKAQGIAASEYYRKHNADGTPKDFKAEADKPIAGFEKARSSVDAAGRPIDPIAAAAAQSQADRKNAFNPAALAARAKVDASRTAAGIATAQTETNQRNIAENGTIPVAPKYAGPGQLTTDVTRDATGRMVNVRAPGAQPGQPMTYAGPSSSTSIPTEFKQGYGNVVKNSIPSTPSGMITNPTSAPIPSLSDGSFMGKDAPSLYDNPAVTQADKTVNGVNRSDLMSALQPAGKGELWKPPVKANPTVPTDERKFAAPIKLSLS